MAKGNCCKALLFLMLLAVGADAQSPPQGQVGLKATLQVLFTGPPDGRSISINIAKSSDHKDLTSDYAEKDGSYSLSLEPGEYDLAARTPAFRYFYLDGIPVRAGETLKLPITLRFSGLAGCWGRESTTDHFRWAGSVVQQGFTGKVVDEFDYTPFAGIRLTVLGHPEIRETFTDSNGNFTFTGLPAGTYYVNTHSARHYDVPAAAFEVVQGFFGSVYSPIEMQSCPTAGCATGPKRAPRLRTCE